MLSVYLLLLFLVVSCSILVSCSSLNLLVSSFVNSFLNVYLIYGIIFAHYDD